MWSNNEKTKRGRGGLRGGHVEVKNPITEVTRGATERESLERRSG